MTFSPAERRIAGFLDSFPAIKRLAKIVYQRTNYWLVPGRAPACEVLDAATLMTQAEWAGIADSQVASAEEFFGYYDKTPWSRDLKRQLAHRLCAGERVVRLLMYDKDHGSVHELARSAAWNFQQGSMLQWLPGGDGNALIFNDVEDGLLVSRVMSLSGASHTVPWPVQVVHPDGREFLSLNYRRLWRIRPEYGYDIDVQNFSPNQPMAEDGLWRVDLSDGRAQLLVALEFLSKHAPRTEMRDAEHKINHAVYSPGGTKFVFMHRWIGPQGKFSRLYCVNGDDREPQLLLDERMVSHYAWRDENTLLAWARSAPEGDHYYLIDVSSGTKSIVGHDVLDTYGDGHPSYSPDGEWLVTDTYPDRARRRHLLLYHLDTASLMHVGAFFAPWRYEGAGRCDLHPRWSPDGRFLSIDSAHEGRRRSYVVDVSRIVGK